MIEEHDAKLTIYKCDFPRCFEEQEVFWGEGGLRSAGDIELWKFINFVRPAPEASDKVEVKQKFILCPRHSGHDETVILMQGVLDFMKKFDL